ncbi:MAG: hypothetical protein WBF38_02735 [Nitrosotalea sp.]
MVGDPTFQYGGISHNFVGGQYQGSCYWGNNYCKGWTLTSTQEQRPVEQNNESTIANGLNVLHQVLSVEQPSINNEEVNFKIYILGGYTPYSVEVFVDDTSKGTWQCETSCLIPIIFYSSGSHKIDFKATDKNDDVGWNDFTFQTLIQSDIQGRQNQSVTNNYASTPVSTQPSIVTPVINYDVWKLMRVLLFVGIIIEGVSFAVILKRRKKRDNGNVVEKYFVCPICIKRNIRRKFRTQEKMEEHMQDEDGYVPSR